MVNKKELKIGDVLLFKTHGSCISKLIRLVTRSVYTHAAIYVGHGHVAESLARGFIVRSHGNKFLLNEDFVHVYRPRKKILSDREVKSIVAKYIGRKYGFKDLIEIFIYTITKRNIFKKRSERLICSEAVAQVYKDMNIDLVPGKSLDLVSPADLSQSKRLKRIYF